MTTIELNPSIIYFTHSKIRNRFSGCSKTIDETYNQIINGEISIDIIPKISVYYHDNKYISLNNRRLYLYKKLYNEERLKTIKVNIKQLPSNSRIKTNEYSLNAKPTLK